MENVSYVLHSIVLNALFYVTALYEQNIPPGENNGSIFDFATTITEQMCTKFLRTNHILHIVIYTLSAYKAAEGDLLALQRQDSKCRKIS